MPLYMQDATNSRLVPKQDRVPTRKTLQWIFSLPPYRLTAVVVVVVVWFVSPFSASRHDCGIL